MKRLIQASLLIASLLLHPLSYADVTPTKDSVILMGGTVKGLRNTTKRDAEITFNDSMKSIFNSLGTKLKITIYDSTEELKSAFDKGEIQGIFGTPLEYLLFEKDLEPRIAMQYKGVDIKQKLLVLVRSQDKNKKIAAFKGTRLSLSSVQDLEALYLNTLLLKSGQNEIPTFFKVQLDAKNSNIAIMDVFFNRSDITIVRESEFKTAIELNPQLGKKLTVLNQSPGFITLIGASLQSQAENVSLLVKRMTALSQSESGLSVLGIVHAEGLVEINKSDLAEVYDLVREHSALKGK